MRESDPLGRDYLTDLLQRAVRVNSVNPPGAEARVAKLFREEMASWGLEARLDEIEPGRANAIGRLPGKGTAPALLLCGRIETVPPGETAWSHDPFGADLAGSRLYGRGSCDMKGGVVAMVGAAASLAKSGRELAGDVILALTAGEETDCCGAYHFARKGLGHVGFIIVPEPTNLRSALAHKGALWLEFVTQGKTAHGSMPDQGHNAILDQLALVERLSELPLGSSPHPLLSPATYSVNTIAGGVKTNVVPDRCSITVDIRTTPDIKHADVIAAAEGLLAQLARERQGFRGELVVRNNKGGVQTSAESAASWLKTAERVLERPQEPCGMTYYTDASALTEHSSAPVIVFGPGDDRMCHQPDEWTDVDDVVRAAQVMTEFAGEYLHG